MASPRGRCPAYFPRGKRRLGRIDSAAPGHSGLQSGQPSAKRLSVIITAHNEGVELLRTVLSVRANTRVDHEIIVVDDGSTDGSCDGHEAPGVRVIRNPARVGVAYSRDVGCAAVGDMFAYLDAHQRVEPSCLDRFAEVASKYDSITCPPCRPLNRRYPVSYGASFSRTPNGPFCTPSDGTPAERNHPHLGPAVAGLRHPGRRLRPRLLDRRPARLGATDFSVAVKAFFTDVDILHVHTGATEHLFRKRIPYETSWAGVWRNHALIWRLLRRPHLEFATGSRRCSLSELERRSSPRAGLTGRSRGVRRVHGRRKGRPRP